MDYNLGMGIESEWPFLSNNNNDAYFNNESDNFLNLSFTDEIFFKRDQNNINSSKNKQYSTISSKYNQSRVGNNSSNSNYNNIGNETSTKSKKQSNNELINELNLPDFVDNFKIRPILPKFFKRKYKGKKYSRKEKIVSLKKKIPARFKTNVRGEYKNKTTDADFFDKIELVNKNIWGKMKKVITKNEMEKGLYEGINKILTEGIISNLTLEFAKLIAIIINKSKINNGIVYEMVKYYPTILKVNDFWGVYNLFDNLNRVYLPFMRELVQENASYIKDYLRKIRNCGEKCNKKKLVNGDVIDGVIDLNLKKQAECKAIVDNKQRVKCFNRTLCYKKNKGVCRILIANALKYPIYKKESSTIQQLNKEFQNDKSKNKIK
jgi:hypothetical protein